MNERFDMADAPRLIGRRIVIELEIRRGDDVPIELRELRGEVERISEGEGVVVQLDGGGEYRLPPDVAMFEPLPDRRFATNDGATLDDVDFVVRYVSHVPPPEMQVPPVQELPDKNPRLDRDQRGGYRSPDA